jgi:hypothetical protein
MVGFFLAALSAVPVVGLLDYTDRQGSALSTPVEAVDTSFSNSIQGRRLA